MAEDERCYRRRFRAPIPVTLLAGDFSKNMVFAFRYPSSVFGQEKTAIGILNHKADRAQASGGIRNPLATSIHSWTRKSYSETGPEFLGN